MRGQATATHPVADEAGRRRPWGRVWPWAQSERSVGLAALGGVLGIAALSYWWTRAPLYNPSSTIDPWLYTALFVNFDQVYPHFANTYYAARLPWIVPGRFLYGVLPVDAAYWVLHGLAFSGGVAALFVLVRRYLGLAAAVVGAATLALTPMYWNAQYWDYIDGVTLTYLLAGLCFGLPLVRGPFRAVSLAAAGVFFAAAVTTNPFVALAAVTYPITYFFVQPETGLRRRFVLAFKDLAALLVGAAALVVALGFYARSNGGLFRYYDPQLDTIRAGVGETYKTPGYEWLRSEPRLLVPLFLLAVAAPLLAFGRRLPPFRFAAGSVGGLTFLTAAVYGWEFFAGGAALEYNYYFSYFSISIALAMASTAALVISLARSHWSTDVGVAAASTTAAVVALGLLYRDERAEWTGPSGGRISIAMMTFAAVAILGALVTRRERVRVFAAVVAIGAVALASHFAINSSSGTFAYSVTAPDNGSLYRAAIDNVSFVNHATTKADPLPAFWYRGADPNLTSIQSMYYYAYTAIGWKLPNVDRYALEQLNFRRPQTLVMLCETRNCAGGITALRRAGYPYAEDSVRRISRGRIRFWAVLLRPSK
jgi:hypothetical protein